MKSRFESKRLFFLKAVSPEEQQNRQAEFETAFLDHYPAVYRILVQLTGDPDEAEDLALETFWRLWKTPPDHTDYLRGWLYRVALRLGFNHLRANRRRLNHEQRAMQQSLDETGTLKPEAQVEAHIEQERVQKVLREMPEKQAQILLLRYNGTSYKEIALALHVKPSSVGALLARAEESFEKLYRSGGEDAPV